MSETTFQANLSRCLAHTIVWEARQHAHGDPINGEDSPPSLHQSSKDIGLGFQTLLPQTSELMQGEMPGFTSAALESELSLAPIINAINQLLFSGGMENIAATQADVLGGSGADMVRSADALSREIDPQYFAARDTAGDVLGQTGETLIDAMANPLMRGEEVAIERALNRADTARGNIDTSSNMNTVRNAINYGQAARDRSLQAANAGINFSPSATSFLGGARSISDIIGKALPNPALAFGFGQASVPNVFPNVMNFGQSLLGSLGGLQGQTMQTEVQRKTPFESMTNFLGAVPSLSITKKGN